MTKTGKIIFDSRQNDDGMASAQISAFQAESLTTALTQILEKYTCKEAATDGYFIDDKPSKPLQDKPSHQSGKMGVWKTRIANSRE